jgi:hypothetical protein
LVAGYEGACPTIRYVKADDYYYVLNLHSEPVSMCTVECCHPFQETFCVDFTDSGSRFCWQGGYATKVVRSKDLSTWEQAANAVLDFKPPGMVAADKGKPPRSGSAYYYTNFTATMEDYIANATDINNSDIDFVDFDGAVYIACKCSWLPAIELKYSDASLSCVSLYAIP